MKRITDLLIVCVLTGQSERGAHFSPDNRVLQLFITKMAVRFSNQTRILVPSILTCLMILFITQGCAAQQQYFVERPQNNSVRQGETALLRCKVGNQQGRAQWTKDGFALGFERSIPAFPRYTVVGSEQLGEHHMRIENATLDDDAEYQCQVGPKGSQKPIRSDARLTVLIPPTTVEIIDHSPGARIQARENEEIVLQCLVRNAKPAADIVWLKRNQEIKFGNQENSTVESAENVRRFDTRSMITIRAQADDNDADYSCEARHPALMATKRAVVTFNVLYPPGPPEISGYTEGEKVRMGQEVNLVCISRGGNPLAQIVWYKNDVKVDYSFVTSGREARNTYSFKADASDNNARFRCEASNQLSVAAMKAEITLTVHFAPKKVTIVGPDDAKFNDTISLECHTSNSNPEARISWILDGRHVKENGSRIATSPEGGWVSTSNLTTVVRSVQHNLSVSCYAVVQDLGQTIVSTKTISVIYPPQAPTIYGFREQSSLLEGTTFRLSCISNDGNPPATLKWFQGNNKKELKSEYTVSGKMATANLEMQAKRDDNGKEFRCEATNPALDVPLVDKVTLRVEFPPSHVTMRVRPEKLRPGQSATMTCESASSNPPSRLTWIRNGVAVPSMSNSMALGTHGGNVTKSTLQVEVTPELHGAVFTCQATNDIGGQNIHDAVTLEVLYKPQFLHPVDYTVDVIEGEPAIVNLSVRANPSDINYSWSRDGTVFKSGKDAGASERITTNGPVLNLTVIRRSDDGPFKVDATNSEGSSSATVRLNVQYPASIVDTRGQVMVSEGSDAFLECRATGNPLTATTVKWRREGFDMEGRTDQRSEAGVAFLTVREVARNDTGAFECVADNGIGQETIWKTWLIVKYKPVMDNSPQYQKAAGNEGERAKLVCRAHGAPNITFQWSREGSTIAGGKYDKVTEQVDVVTWESHLFISNVASDDYGQYECVARNEMGFDRAVVHLSGTSRPDVPISLRVLNVSHDAVELAWKPGFDGGLPQAYQIRYRQMGTEFFKYVDVYPANSTSMAVGGLALGTEYLFSVMAFNNLGKSNYTYDVVKARTSKEAPVVAPKPRDLEVRPGDMPKVLIIVGTMVGTALLVLNVALIACFVRRRHRKRLAKGPWDEAGLLSETMSSRGDTPKIIIIAVSTAGALLLVINITLITCYLIRRRKKKCMEEAMSSEGGSSKSATIEMYAPSSYNETVNGETLSSISEKSESYSQNGSHSDYANEDATKAAVSTYLIDQGDGQVAYGTYRVGGGGVNGGPNPNGNVVHAGTLSRPPKTVNFDMGDDNYIDTLRRNAFSPANDPSAMYGKSRGNPAIAANPDAYYNVNPSPVSSNEARYAPYPPVHPSFGPAGNHNNRYNPLSEPVNQSPYTPMGTLNIPAANGTLGHHSNGYVAARTTGALPVNLPLPLPMSMQQGSHGHFSSFSSDGPPSLEAPAHFSGPSMATVRSLETEGHLV